MRNSKMIKGSDEAPRTKTWVLKLSDWWSDLPPATWIHKGRSFWSRAKRLARWSKFMWTNWDFDGHSIYPLLEYKLKRIQYCLIHGWSVQDEYDMKALRVALKLVKRLSEDHHENALYGRHDKKWGPLQTWFTPTDGEPGYSTFKSSRSKAAEREDHLKMFEVEARWRARDEKWFFNILRVHARRWWD